MFFDCVTAFILKKHPPSLLYFSTKYELTEAQASGILNWLIHENFLHTVGDRKIGYVPTRNFAETPVIEVIDAIENQNRRVPVMPDDTTKEFVQSMLGTISEHCNMMMKELTFEKLVERIGSNTTIKKENIIPSRPRQKRRTA